MNIIYKPRIITILTILAILVSSCSKKTDEVAVIDGKTQLIVSASLKDYTTAQTTINKASETSNNPLKENITLSNGLEMQAELTAVDLSKTTNISTDQNKNNRAATTTTPKELTTGIYYKLVIFDNTGKYVEERNYKYKEESIEAPLYLTVGSTYTFIAYSINTTDLASLPTLEGPIANADKTLTNCNVNASYNRDLLFFKKNLTISSTTKNYLQIVFDHTFNHVQTTIIANNTEYEITALSANLVNSRPNVSINFNTGAVTPSGGASSPTYDFTINPTDKTKATSENLIVNIESGGSILKIGSITIGPLTMTNITPFSNVTLTPGTNYQLTLTIMPIDVTLDYGGQKAVRINGQIWMRYNLDAPDINKPDEELPDALGPGIQGGYYQWGQKESFASGTAIDGPFSNYSDAAPQDMTFFQVWNTGTLSNKGSKDPCPSNYRLPTETEFKSLINNTVATYEGEQSSSLTNYNYALRLTSKRKKSVIMTIPAQGYAGIAGIENSVNNYGFGSFQQRGKEIYLKSQSYVYNKTIQAANNSNVSLIVFQYQLLQATNGTPSIYTGPGGGQTSAFANGHPIRCIAIASNRGSTVITDREIDKQNGSANF